MNQLFTMLINPLSKSEEVQNIGRYCTEPLTKFDLPTVTVCFQHREKLQYNKQLRIVLWNGGLFVNLSLGVNEFKDGV